MRRFRLLLVYFRISALGELAYRANFFFQLLQSAVELATAVAALSVVFAYTDTLGGWRPDEVLALVGVFFLVGGAIRVVIEPSMEQLIESVHDGTLDFTLTKPEDAQFLATIQRADIWKLTDVCLGASVLALALVRLGARIGVSQVIGFCGTLAAGGMIVYSFWLILATLAFWFVRVGNILVVFQSMYEAGRWPVNIYPRWLRFGLTFVVPVAFATSVPARALAGGLSTGALAGAGGLAAALLLVSRLFWRAGLRRYSGASA
ncbi:MAG TPA: ABC-2 family transporter protein [Bacteroidota bacterium]|nr:ABC-2 family transporter protein [Bacteroidota bacterium]